MTREARGMTLIEVMVASTLLSVVLAVSTTLFVTVNQSAERVRRVGDTQETARLALEQLAADIRSAGMGAQFGSVGIAPATGNVRRVPVIYSGPDIVVSEGSPDGGVGSTIVTNSIFIISGQPTNGVLSADGTGMAGTVTDAGVGSPLTIACSAGDGGGVDCGDPSFVNNGDDFRVLVPLPAGGFQPLIVGDLRSAVYLRPTSVTAVTGSPPTQTLDFTERTASAFAPDPRAPFGFAPGATLQRARVLHYYLWPSASGTSYDLKRSNPVLSATAGNGACDATDAPFIDETNSPTGPAGIIVGAGPVESLQIRYVVDPNASDDPRQFQLRPVNVCSTATMPLLREIRLQVVARSLGADKTIGNSDLSNVYSTPGFEGTATSNTAFQDAYPRRTFTINAVPRNLQGERL